MSKKKGARGNGSANSKPSGGHQGPKKNAAPAAKKAAAAPAKRGKQLWIVAAVVAVVAVVAIASANSGSKGGAGASATPEEAKYIGRFLPAGYVEPKLAKVVVYSSDTPMTKVTAKDEGTQLSLPKAEILAKKNVVFTYGKAGQPIPIMAYVKPSGSLFVGVSFCPPCQGEGQTITTDLALTCDSCGTKRNLETMVGQSGTCKLYPLDEIPAKLVGDKVVVEKAALDAWTPQPLDRPTSG